ncbi:lysophospholipase [Rubinisphaera margarita]|uniref:lysophospholipase n=1 Tax=Rubinisphaera margarita TaxID=2909586 RepID=UPI001EE9074B|nr:lysophospholipase [Rubinisphaera margarita]MCG6157985.1 lysophospholipase [Rubinisphaera margarita]
MLDASRSAEVETRFRRGFRTTLSYPRALLGNYRLPELPYVTEERYARGLVLILPGIEGLSSLSHSLVHGLNDGGVSQALEIFDWTVTVKPGVFNLWLPNRSSRLAARIAEHIADYKAQHPDRPVSIIGHSGGGAMIPKTLEALAPGIEIESAVMIAPALSPGYDLAPALQRIRRQLFCYRSRLDWYFLGFGTWTMGTLDRRFGTSGGNRGFRVPCENDRERFEIYRQKYVEVPYRFSMIRDWHYGGHLSCMNRVFVERHIAPRIVPEISHPQDQRNDQAD